MSIKCYVGRMGSGKSYEVVSMVILGALRSGRRVVSNIVGLNYDEMVLLLAEEGIPADSIGELVTIEHDEVFAPDFWLTDENAQGERPSHVLRAGDLLALDEIWRFWDGFNKPDACVMNFFRMHRHFTHPTTGVSCDVALITQDIMDIGRKVRAVVEETYRMEKLTVIGAPKRYRVDVCMGGQSRKALRSIQRKYDPRFFALYNSHSGKKEGDADAKEVNIDGRGNILKGALFSFIIPIGLLVLIVSILFFWRFFNREPEKPKEGGAIASTEKKQKNQNLSADAKKSKNGNPEINRDWRVVGYVLNDALPTFVLMDRFKVRRLVQSPTFKFSPGSIEVKLPEGDFAVNWMDVHGETPSVGRGL